MKRTSSSQATGVGRRHGAAGAAVRLACAAVCSTACLNASAAAWTQGSGEGQLILMPSYSLSTQAWGSRHTLRTVPDFRKAEVFTLAEFGVHDRLTLMLAPSLRSWSSGGAGAVTGAGATDMGFRWRLFQSTDSVLSLQTLYRLPDRGLTSQYAQVGSQVREVDLRLLAGRNFRIGSDEAFLNLEGAYRFRLGDPQGEARFDGTVGWRPLQGTLVLFQSFNTISNGAGPGTYFPYHYHNLQLSAVQELNSTFSLQLGARGTVAGHNALRERGVVGGLWVRY